MRTIFPASVFALLILLAVTACRTVPPEGTFDPRSTQDLTQLELSEFSEVEGGRQIDPKWLVPSASAYRLGVGDWVDIEILGVKGSRAGTFIMPDGRLYYDLADGVLADGLTLVELGEALALSLSRDYTSPSISVTLREVNSRRAWLLGRVNKPGLYPLSQPTTLLEAISLAGGLFASRFSGATEELADLGSSIFLRQGKALPIDFAALLREGDLSQNIYLQDGDYIYLPSVGTQSIQVLGAVVRPQSIGFKDEIDLISAIAKVRGPSPDAHLDRVLIIRGSLKDPKVAVVDLGAILGGRASNFKLKASDIVWVPDRPFQRLESYFWLILDSAATTIAVREGSNAVEQRDPRAPSVTIPIGQ